MVVVTTVVVMAVVASSVHLVVGLVQLSNGGSG